MVFLCKQCAPWLPLSTPPSLQWLCLFSLSTAWNNNHLLELWSENLSTWQMLMFLQYFKSQCQTGFLCIFLRVWAWVGERDQERAKGPKSTPQLLPPSVHTINQQGELSYYLRGPQTKHSCLRMDCPQHRDHPQHRLAPVSVVIRRTWAHWLLRGWMSKRWCSPSISSKSGCVRKQPSS